VAVALRAQQHPHQANGSIVLRPPVIRAEVVDMSTGIELGGVEIREVYSGIGVSTTDSARLADLASITRLSPLYPKALVVFRKPGYRPDSLALDMTKDTSDVTIALVPAPLGEAGSDGAIALSPAVTTSEKMHASNLEKFLSRRVRLEGSGKAVFIGPEELRKDWDAFPDMKAVLASHGMSGTKRCGVVIYTDGQPGASLFQGSNAFEAIEYYADPAWAPKQYAPHTGACSAVLLLWTKGT
jgi:hypothetical protein